MYKFPKKLTSSPSCLVVSDNAMDIRMERFLREQKQLSQSAAKILELNPTHKIIQKVNNDIKLDSEAKNSEITKQLVRLIFDQACIVEGEQVTDPAGFAKRLDELMQKALLA